MKRWIKLRENASIKKLNQIYCLDLFVEASLSVFPFLKNLKMSNTFSCFGENVEIEGDNWMICEVLVGDRRGFGKGTIVFRRLEEPGVRVVIGFDFEGFCLVGRFLLKL